MRRQAPKSVRAITTGAWHLTHPAKSLAFMSGAPHPGAFGGACSSSRPLLTFFSVTLLGVLDQSRSRQDVEVDLLGFGSIQVRPPCLTCRRCRSHTWQDDPYLRSFAGL